MRSRVMPGSLVTIDRRVPVSRLNSVDLPTLGRPTITKDGSFGGIKRLSPLAAGAEIPGAFETRIVAHLGEARKGMQAAEGRVSPNRRGVLVSVFLVTT